MPASFRLSGPVGANVRVGREDTVRMKRALQRLGFYDVSSGEIDHIADDAMLEGIRAFQKASGLAASGETKPGDATERLMRAALSAAESGPGGRNAPGFRVGAPVGAGGANRPADVAATKRALAQLDIIPEDEATAAMAPRTFNGAIELFQSEFNLKRDGKLIPGGETERILARVMQPLSARIGAENSVSGQVAQQGARMQTLPVSGMPQASRGLLNDDQVANIIFNESRSLHGPRIDEVRRTMAHAILNGDDKKGRGRPVTANSFIKGKISNKEKESLKKIKQIVSSVRGERKRGIDLAKGAMHFNFRDSKDLPGQSKEMIRPRKNQKFILNIGPLTNSYPTPELGKKDIYFTLFE